MRKIKLHAYWAQNLGDDLMVHILLKRYPQCQFYSDSWSQYSSMFNSYPNFLNAEGLQKKYGRQNHLLNILTLYRKKNFYIGKIRSRYLAIKDAVYIGGSLYMQESSETVEERIKREDCKLNDNNLFVIGANFGPYYSEAFRSAFSKYFQRCKAVTFRDRYSYELFAKENDNVYYAPDVVFNLEQEFETRESTQNTVVISVIDFYNRPALCAYAQLYDRLIVQLCETCINSGKTPVLMSFCKEERDEIAIDRITDQMKSAIKAATKTYFYRGNLFEAVRVISEADSVVATRFHAMILALRFRKPFYSIVYNEKLKNVMKDLNCTNYCEIQNLSELNAEMVISGCVSVPEIDTYAENAQHHFEQFEKYIRTQER